MGGAAGVTGAMHALAGRKVNRNVIGIIGLVENMPDGNAQRPGDVVTSLSGQTVEVINTDAEGRLVLADVLTYLQHTYKPQAIVDMATLTGAILVSLGKEHAGLFSNSDSLSEAVMQAGRDVEETSWRMPMAYDDVLKSHIAGYERRRTYGGRLQRHVFGNVLLKMTPLCIWISLARLGQIKTDQPRQRRDRFWRTAIEPAVNNWRDEMIWRTMRETDPIQIDFYHLKSADIASALYAEPPALSSGQKWDTGCAEQYDTISTAYG